MNFSTEILEMGTLPNGQPLTAKAFHLEGNGPGPHVHIQASVHGAELQGNAVIFELLKFLTKNPFMGSMTIIPLVNPRGTSTKTGTYTQGRNNPVTGNNWNRNFVDLTTYNQNISGFGLEKFWNSYRNEKKQIQIKAFKDMQEEAFENILRNLEHYGVSENIKFNLILQKHAAKADIVLDLHTGPLATRYLYAGDFMGEKLKDLPFPHVLLIPSIYGGAMDEATFITWTKMADYASSLGESFDHDFETYTVELGSEEVVNQKLAKQDTQRLLHLFAKRGIIEEKLIEKNAFKDEVSMACKIEDYRTYYCQKGGLIEYLKAPGEYVKQGEALYSVLDLSAVETASDLDHSLTYYTAKSDAIVINSTPSASMYEGMTVCQVMENYFELK